jgi:hypothetical protein
MSGLHDQLFTRHSRSPSFTSPSRTREGTAVRRYVELYDDYLNLNTRSQFERLGKLPVSLEYFTRLKFLKNMTDDLTGNPTRLPVSFHRSVAGLHWEAGAIVSE